MSKGNTPTDNSGKIEKRADELTNYLCDNYYDDVERMAHIKAIQGLMQTDHDIAEIVDKVALFNGIKKSSPPQKSKAVGRKIIEGIGFILYGP